MSVEEHLEVSKLVTFTPKYRHFRHLHHCPSCRRAVEEDNLLCEHRGDHRFLCFACLEVARNRFGLVEVEGHLGDAAGAQVKALWPRTGLGDW